MYIVCPKCNSFYKILESLLGVEGRTVRCANCENTWFQSPDEPAEMENPAEAEITDMVSGEKVEYENPIIPKITAEIEEEPIEAEESVESEELVIEEEAVSEEPKEPMSKADIEAQTQAILGQSFAPAETGVPVEERLEEAPPEAEESKKEELELVEDIEVELAPISDEMPSDEEVNTVQEEVVPPTTEEASPEELPITHPSEDIVNQVQSILGGDVKTDEPKEQAEEEISTDAVFSRISAGKEELKKQLKEQEASASNKEETSEKYAELPFDFEKTKQLVVDLPEEKKKKYITIIGYVALIMFFVIFFSARYQIAKTFRFTRPIYKLFNVEAVIPGEELELLNITRRSYEIDYERKMEISGFVFNPTEDIQVLPMITAELLDEDTNYLQDREIMLEQLEIKAKERIGFNIVITTPARNAKYAVVTFKRRPKLEN